MKGISKIAPFGLRMPPDLSAWLHTKAKENYRSLNGEVVRRLEESKRREEAANASPS